MVMTSNFISIDDFAKNSIVELEDSFITKYNEYKNKYSHILELCNISYDELCQKLFTEFKKVLSSKDYRIFYIEEAQRVDDHLEIFSEIYDDLLVKETIEKFYLQAYNHAYFRAALIIQKRLGECFNI